MRSRLLNIFIHISGIALLALISFTDSLAQAPVISSFTPTAQTQSGVVVISGNNFTGTTSVKFGGSNAGSFTVVNANTINATVGAGSNGLITVTNPSGTGISGSSFTFCPASATQPGVITGNISVCGYINQTYTIRKVSNAATYSWTLSQGTNATISSVNGSGPNDTSVVVTFLGGFTKDTLVVRSVTACGAISTPRTAILNATYPPPNLTTISSSNQLVCVGQSTNFTVTSGAPILSQSSAVLYRWTIPSNTTITSANADSSTITLTLNGSFSSSTGAYIYAKSQSACGVQSVGGISFFISYSPATPTAINSSTGYYSACVGSKITYTAVAGASSTSYRPTASFRWTIPAKTQIISATFDSSSIKLQFNTGYAGGILRATPVTSCGKTGIFRSAPLTAGTCPTAPASVSGIQELCPYYNPATGRTSAVTYTVATVPGITKYSWVLPSGATQVSGDSTNVIGVVFDTTVLSRYGEGRIYAGSVNSSGLNSLSFAEIRIFKTKPILGIITGPSDVCSYIGKDTPIRYSVANVTNVTSFDWSVPTGTTIISGQGTNSIQVKFNNSFSHTGIISVVGNSNCGNRGPRMKLLLTLQAFTPGVIQQSFIPSIPANSNVTGSGSVTLRIKQVPRATEYVWSLSSGAKANITHLNASGPEDTAVTISFSSGFTNDTLKVSSKTQCNTSIPRKLLLYSNPATPISIHSKDVTGNNSTFSSLPEIINEEDNLSEAEVYPNPSNQFFIINTNKYRKGEAICVQVIDLAGRIIETKKVISGGHLELGASYKAGSYVLIMKQGAQVRRSRLIKF